MQLESLNNTSVMDNQNLNKIGQTSEVGQILNQLLDLGYESVDEDTFMIEVFGENNEEIKQIALELNTQIREISMDEYRKVASPLMMQVVAVNDDHTVSVNKPTDRNGDDCWTHVYNPTIFNHLEVGDEVLIGYYEGGQKSNCWVMFAKTDDLANKTILKDINDVNNKIKEHDNKLKALENEIIQIKDLISSYHDSEE